MTDKRRRTLASAAKIVLTCGLLTWLLASGRLEPGQIAAVPICADLALLFALSLGAMTLPAVRWWWLLRIQRLGEPLGKVIGMTWAAYLAAIILPGAASGDLAKGYLILRRRPLARARAFSTVLADRVMGLQSLLALGAAAILVMAAQGTVDSGVQAMALTVLALLLALTLGVALLLLPRPRGLLLRVVPGPWRAAWSESFDDYRLGKAGLAGCFGLSLASSAMTMASFGVAARLLGHAIPWDATFLAGPLVVLSNCLPVTPGGIGAAEAVSSALFARLGSANGAEMMVLVRACSMLLSAPALLALAFARLRQTRSPAESLSRPSSDAPAAEAIAAGTPPERAAA